MTSVEVKSPHLSGATVARPAPRVVEAERILVVDDDPLNRELLCHVLASSGYATAQASDGAQALKQLVDYPTDLVLLDITMPDRDGLRVLQDIRELALSSELPVLMVTSEQQRETMIEAFGRGANDYLIKPIDPEVALARVATHLQLKRTLRALQDSEERYALAALGSNDGIWDWDLRTNCVYFSPRWKSMLGLNSQEVAEDPADWMDRVHDDDRDRVALELQQHLEGETGHFQSELRLHHETGGYRWMLCRGLAVRDRDGKALRIAGSLTDVNDGKVADALTQLPNRLLFMDRLKRCVDQYRRWPELGFAVLYLDLDNFKIINDSLGHVSGDELLIMVARRLLSMVRATEATVARMGGDEFAVLLEYAHDQIPPLVVAKRIQDCLKSPFSLHGHSDVFVSASIGISIASDAALAAEDVLREADTSMNQAKAEGKSGFRVYDPEMQQQLKQRLQLESDLRQALNRDEFVVYYQPVVELETRRVVALEALVRWVHPRRGVVSPGEFISVTEEIGLMAPLGRLVLQKACRQVADWKSIAPALQDLQISVNVSGRQLAHGNFVSDVTGILDATGLSPTHLRLEVTESVLMENPDAAARQLNQLRCQGVTVAVDDFGTGYSSLAYLHRLPLDALKIDRSFVSRMLSCDVHSTIARSIVTLATGLGLDLVAEGIETEPQWKRLVELGCQYGQGYLFARPLPANEALTWLQSQGEAPATPRKTSESRDAADAK